MHTVFASLPLVAAFLAVPQFLPQLARVRRAGTMAGVSWSWAALTSVNNAAWLAYFALSGLWTALVPAISATVLAAWLGELLCWGVFGIHVADPRLIVLGATGVAASSLVLARVSWPRTTPLGGLVRRYCWSPSRGGAGRRRPGARATAL
jgi:uncharacterized protein with PQ loop repeat